MLLQQRPSEKDLAKSSYKTNREVKNLGVLLHVGKPLLAKYGNFKRRKPEIFANLPSPFQKKIFQTQGDFFGKNRKSSLDRVAQDFLKR